MAEPMEISAGRDLWAMTFSANGEYLISGHYGNSHVQTWRVLEDAREAPATVQAAGQGVTCLAVSNDGRWIAAGTYCGGDIFVWNAKTGERLIKKWMTMVQIHGVEFSPDSTHLVVAADDYTATVWRIATTKQVHTLHHGFLGYVHAAKYSPGGDRIATATPNRIRVWDSGNGCLLSDVPVKVIPLYNTGLVWFDNHLFVVSQDTVQELDATTGSTVSQWPVPKAGENSCIAIPKRKGFIAYSTERTVTFWHTSTHSNLGLVEHSEWIRSIAFSPDDRLLAIGGQCGKFTIHRLSSIVSLDDGTQELSQNDGISSSSVMQRVNPSTRYAPPTSGLREWAKAALANRSWRDALRDAACSTIPRLTVYQVLSEHLESVDRVTDALDCVGRMESELESETNLGNEHLQWTIKLRQRSCKKLEYLGDTAIGAQQCHEAIPHSSIALSLEPSSTQDIFIERSKAHMAIGSWEQALVDANQAIALDPSLPWGYEIKHAALHKAKDYDNAIATFEMMVSKMEQSPDPEVQRCRDQYVSPSSTRAEIRKVLQKTIRRLPLELINTKDGRLYNRSQHASIFESLPLFKELVSSTTRRTDYVRIKREVRRYFRYVMLSHRWEDDEPLYQQMIQTTVYDLTQSPTHDKLEMFCKITQDAGFIWAWSDTCCINKLDHFVLQEALVAMFKWYQGSALTIVYLRGVHSLALLGALVKSLWNTRAWTLQEYIAAKVVHFYTEEWTPYLDLQLWNHKLSREVISEMEEATGVSGARLRALRPGLSNIREKLRLASTRKTTLVEDAAYSLLGIFSVSGMSAIYGEGESSLGRLLAHILAASGDVSILAWTGESGPFNTCLPAYIKVFGGPGTSHLPPPVLDAEIERIISPSFDFEIALKLYDRLNDLPAPWFAASRMKLPCISFQLPAFSRDETPSGVMYCADTPEFGTMEIKTRYDLSRMKSLYLVHPWLDTLLERDGEESGPSVEDDVAPPSLDSDDEELYDTDLDPSSFLEPKLPPAPARTAPPMDKGTRVRRLVARLRQPFGALLLAQASSTGRTVDHRRVATDSLITVRLWEDVPLAQILDNVRTLDVL